MLALINMNECMVEVNKQHELIKLSMALINMHKVKVTKFVFLHSIHN